MPRTKSTASRVRGALLMTALVALALLPACRCHGGFGRTDNATSWNWTMDTLAAHSCADNSAFVDHISNIPDFLTPDFGRSGRELSATANLYTTGVGEACWCPDVPR